MIYLFRKKSLFRSVLQNIRLRLVQTSKSFAPIVEKTEKIS